MLNFMSMVYVVLSTKFTNKICLNQHVKLKVNYLFRIIQFTVYAKLDLICGCWSGMFKKILNRPWHTLKYTVRPV